MPIFRRLLILLPLIILIPIKTFANNQEIVVTIKPIYSLLIGVSGARSKVGLLLKDNSSPHDYNLKPSQIKMLQDAKIIFYVDDNYETFLQKPLSELPSSIKKVNIIKDAKINTIPLKSVEIVKNDEKTSTLDYDVHFWLDPKNAIKIVKFFAKKLAEINPELREVYEKNAENMAGNLQQLDDELRSLFADVQQQPFLTYHDGYRYLSKAYNLKNLGSITQNHDGQLTPSEIANAKETIKKNKVKCLFDETQFNNKIVKQIVDETDIDSEELDPIAANLQNNHNQYFKMIRLLAYKMKNCLD